MEGMKADSRALSTLVSAAKGDLRGCLNTLQVSRKRSFRLIFLADGACTIVHQNARRGRHRAHRPKGDFGHERGGYKLCDHSEQHVQSPVEKASSRNGPYGRGRK